MAYGLVLRVCRVDVWRLCSFSQLIILLMDDIVRVCRVDEWPWCRFYQLVISLMYEFA